jgi:preprotein translocase subunit SecB
VTPEMLPMLVLVETPRIVFPFARAIIANATRDGGFPPLMINPIDFAELLRRQQSDAQTLSSAGAGTALA